MPPVSVFPAFQKKSIGSALMWKGMNHAGEKGGQAIFVLGAQELQPGILAENSGPMAYALAFSAFD